MKRRTLTRLATAGALLGLMVTAFPLGCGGDTPFPKSDALEARVRSELAGFIGWLNAHRVKGYIGEFGWPNDQDVPRWNALAQKWYADARAAGLWTSAWATGEWWGTTYKLSMYVRRAPGEPLGDPRPSAVVLERQPRSQMRGISVAGGEFGAPSPQEETSSFSNANPGVYDRDHHYDSQESFDYLASRGVGMVRLPFRWERVQPRLGAPLDEAELGRLTAAVGRAQAAGLGVILDVHNYGSYWLFDGTHGVRRAVGSPQVTEAHFVDLWRRLSEHFKDHAGVVAYGLMNEPIHMPASRGLRPAQLWERVSQSALDAIRARDDGKLVMVSGYRWADVREWASRHPRAWIRDPIDNFRYEGHHYWDRGSSGKYAESYAAEVRYAMAEEG